LVLRTWVAVDDACDLLTVFCAEHSATPTATAQTINTRVTA